MPETSTGMPPCRLRSLRCLLDHAMAIIVTATGTYSAQEMSAFLVVSQDCARSAARHRRDARSVGKPAAV